MVTLAKNVVTPVWLFLIATTLVSWFVGAEHGTDDNRLATVIVMSVAFIKVRFVGMYFMELRHAPAPLKLAFEAWTIVVCAAILGIYLLA